MAYNVKYQTSFYDLLGAQCVVSFCVDGYSGDIIPLIIGEDNVKITRTGDENNPFDPIRTSSSTIAIKVETNCLLFIADLQEIDDTTMSCVITSGGASFNGFLVPDQTARTFSAVTGDISISAKDIFSILQGATAYDDTGNLIFGKQTVYQYLIKQFQCGANNSYDINFNFIARYTQDLTASPLIGARLLEQIQVRAESFNDTNGIPNNAYDIIKKIASSIGAYCFTEGEEANLICISDLEDSSHKSTVYFQSDTQETNILVKSSEQITSIRGAKEVSADLSYSSSNGLLLNSFFKGWDSGNTHPLEWTLVAGQATTEKVSGNNRIEGNSGVRLTSIYNPLTDFGTAAFPGISQNIHVYKGYSYKLTFVVVGHVYSDWDTTTGKVGSEAEPPAINPYITIVSSAAGTTKDLLNASSGLQWVDGAGGNGIYLQLDDSGNVNSLSLDIPECPFEGDMQIAIGGVSLSESVYGINSSTMDRTSAVYKSIVLDSANINNGETDYLTQSKNYSLKNSRQDTYLDSGVANNVAGALYNAIAYTQTDSGKSIAVGDLLDLNSFYRIGETVKMSLMHQLIRSFMAFYRTTKTHITFEVYSNIIKFGDLIVFDGGILPNNYMQLTNEYSVRTCIQSITAVELNMQYLTDQTTGFPSDTEDLYEHYNVVV